MASPTCQVKEGAGAYQATTNGIDVASGASVTIKLADVSGVTQWSISCVATDETQSAATVTSGLTIDSVNKTAAFTMPAATGIALIFESKVNNGIGVDGTSDPSLTTRFVVHVLSNGTHRVGALGETTEAGTTAWMKKFNQAVRSAASGGGSTPTGTGFRHVTGGAEDAASAKVDLTASADVTVPAAGVLHSSGTAVTTGNVALGSEVSGTLPVANGGTGLTALGTALQVLRTNAGATAMEWAAASGGGSPGGSSGDLQYNNAGAFGGMSKFTYASDVVTMASGAQIAVTPQVTAGSAPIVASSSVGAWAGIIDAHNTFGNYPILQVNSANVCLGDADGLQWTVQINAVGLRLWSRGSPGYLYAGASGTQTAQWTTDGIQFGTGAPDFGGGVSVIGIDNASTNPSTNPTGGVVLYSDGGDGSKLKDRLPSGQVDETKPRVDAAAKMNNEDGFLTSTTTTDATPTTIATIATTSGTMGQLDVVVMMYQSGGSLQRTKNLRIHYENVGGTLTTSTCFTDVNDDRGPFSADTTITTSGTSLIVQVTGIAATTIYTRGTYNHKWAVGS